MRPLALITPFVLAIAGLPAQAQTAVSAEQINALEARIAQLEVQSQALREQAAQALAAAREARAALDELRVAQQTAAAAPPAADAAAPTGANGNAFNPAISLVLNGTYAHHSLPPGRFARSGFPVVGEGAPREQGLSIGESELSFAANVDDKFYGQLTLAVGSEDGQDEVGLEEAFIDTNNLPGGLSLRAGRFFSNVGYLNGHHTHTDHFTERPLTNQVFLGDQFFDDGLQLRWVAPTDLFVEVGGELLRGEHFPLGGAGNGGIGGRNAFAHIGGDIGLEQEWLVGGSWLHADLNGGEDGFSGRSDLYVADLTWKWAPQGNFKDGGLSLRSEVFLEDRNGRLAATDADSMLPWNGQRGGFYAQGLYRLNRYWETGYRYDRLWSESGLPLDAGFDPSRHTLMLTWLNSEFSLLRLQLSHERVEPDAVDNQVSLQYQVNLGAHGAHKF